MNLRLVCVVVVGLLSILFCSALLTVAQTPTQTASALPRLVRFSGTVKDLNGNPMTGMVGITFALYSEQAGGAPLWLETQNVTADGSGHYTVLLGSTTGQGLPESIFASEQAHWVGVQVSGQAEQPRVLLVSAPYALKAGDAETIGGLPPSAFVLAGSASSTHTGTSVISGAIGGSGTQNYIPIWTDSSGDLGNSILYQSGTTEVGINTTTPAATLDVNGIINAATGFNLGNNLFATGSYASENAFLGYAGNSKSGAAGFSNTASGYQALFNNIASYNTAHGAGALFSNTTGSFNTAGGYNALKNNTTGGTNTAVGYQALVTNSTGGNNTALGYQAGPNTSGLSYATAIGANATVSESNAMVLGGTGAAAVNVGIGTATPAYTLDAAGIVRSSSGGFKFPDGTVQTTAASGGGGTITGVTAGTDLTGGGTSGNVTLNLDTTKVPQLASANTFTASQTVNGNITASGGVNAEVVNVTNSFWFGGRPFVLASSTNGITAVGLNSLGFNTTGSDNTATGNGALYTNTSGNRNTADGYDALQSNSSGTGNVAVGYGALKQTNAPYNTAAGYEALISNTGGNNNTASGAFALGENTTGSYNTALGSSTLTGNTTGPGNVAVGFSALYKNNGSYNVATGYDALYANNGNYNTAGGNQALQSNSSGSYNTASGNQALQSNSSGSYNTASGSSALQNNTTGSNNTASGVLALQNNTTGGLNTAAGSHALSSNTTGAFNAANGYSALSQNTTGSYNTAEGYAAGVTVDGSSVTANNNTAVGAGAEFNTGTLQNATAIGSNAVVAESNAMVLGSISGVGFGTSNVNVGIGTTTPAYTLDVHGTGNFSDGVNGVSNSASTLGVSGSNSATSGVAFGVNGTTSSPTGTGTGGTNLSNSGGYGVTGFGGIGVGGVSTYCNVTSCGPGGGFFGFTAPSGSGFSGSDGIVSYGGDGDPDDANGSAGGTGIYGQGGTGYGIPFFGGDAPGGFLAGGKSAIGAISQLGDGVDGYAGSGYAGNFVGDVDVTGTIYAGTKDFKIDHPLDPANKYLVHASVESSEMLNIYTGNVKTDDEGRATVQLPEWFEALNTDFRYQLTVIGQFAQAIVGRKLENNRFEIKTSAPDVEVSWQITGVRQDAYAKANPLVVEQEKGPLMRGYYIHPELYGAPPKKQIEWARHPNLMRKMQERSAPPVAVSQQPGPAGPR